MNSTETKNEPAMNSAETVTVRLFKGTTGKYTSDVFVGLNGKGYQIQRGVDVQVPAGVAEILRHSEEQDALAASHMEQMANTN